VPTNTLEPELSGGEVSSAERALEEFRQRRELGWLAKLPGFSLVEAWLTPPELAPVGERFDAVQRRREAPAWLVSLIVHIVVLLLLALIPLAGDISAGLQLVLGEAESGAGADFALAPDAGDLDLQVSDLPEVTSSMPDFSELSTLDIKPLATEPSSDAIASGLSGLAIDQGLSGRSGALKNALLNKFGGTPETEGAVALGLKWLAKYQQSDGSWSLAGPYADGSSNDSRAGATAMALNAFLGAGYTHKSGEYADHVSRGLKYLISRQDKEGFFATGDPSHHQMYAQALATITLCEAYGMTGDSLLRDPASRAIRFAEYSQSRLKGWRYIPRQDADLSVTGWFLMALMTGKMAGLEPNPEVIRSVSEYLESVSHKYGARYSYQRSERPSLSMTAEGLLCRQYLGWPRNHEKLLEGIEVDLLPNAPDLKSEVYSVYFWYYATQVLHHVGGDAWTQWNDQMKVVLPALQLKSGREAGSWDPINDQFGPSGGRLYVTSLNLYCLEVYYRHLALYDLKR
jgi:hypothetical protein